MSRRLCRCLEKRHEPKDQTACLITVRMRDRLDLQIIRTSPPCLAWSTATVFLLLLLHQQDVQHVVKVSKDCQPSAASKIVNCLMLDPGLVQPPLSAASARLALAFLLGLGVLSCFRLNSHRLRRIHSDERLLQPAACKCRYRSSNRQPARGQRPLSDPTGARLHLPTPRHCSSGTCAAEHQVRPS